MKAEPSLLIQRKHEVSLDPSIVIRSNYTVWSLWYAWIAQWTRP